MKTEMQDTSLNSLKEVRNLKIVGRRLQVYEAIKKMGACSNSMIARELGLSINRVTGRVKELRDYFKVVGFSHKGLCPVTDRLVMFWKVVKDFDTWDKVKGGNNLITDKQFITEENKEEILNVIESFLGRLKGGMFGFIKKDGTIVLTEEPQQIIISDRDKLKIVEAMIKCFSEYKN